MAKTPKWDGEQRTKIYEKVTAGINEAMEDDGILVADGLAFELPADADGCKRIATIKVIIKAQDYTMDDVLAEVTEKEDKAVKKAADKEKAAAKAKAKKEKETA